MKTAFAALAGLAAAAGSFAAPAAHAQNAMNFQPGWYITLDGGRGSTTAQNDYVQSRFDELNALGASYNHSGSTTATAYALAFGYQFTPYWGFELGYGYYGKVSGDINGTGQWTGTLHDDMKATGITLMLVGTAPIASHLVFVGKVGIMRSHVELDTAGSIQGPGGSVYPLDTANSQGINFGYSIGLGWRFNQYFGIHGGWSQFRDVGSAASGGSDNLNFTYVGVRFAF